MYFFFPVIYKTHVYVESVWRYLINNHFAWPNQFWCVWWMGPGSWLWVGTITLFSSGPSRCWWQTMHVTETINKNPRLGLTRWFRLIELSQDAWITEQQQCKVVGEKNQYFHTASWWFGGFRQNKMDVICVLSVVDLDWKLYHLYHCFRLNYVYVVVLVITVFTLLKLDEDQNRWRKYVWRIWFMYMLWLYYYGCVQSVKLLFKETYCIWNDSLNSKQ